MDTPNQTNQTWQLRERASTSDDARNRHSYIAFIKSCFQPYPEAFAYYDRLIDHLESGPETTQSTLQAVELFEIVDPHERAAYPKDVSFGTPDWNDRQRNPRIAVLNGFPSPDCIAFLGARWNLRPEFFIGNLDPTGKRASKGGSYELPTLPSLRDNLVRVQLVSPLRSLVDKPKISMISRVRSDIEAACSRYEKSLSTDRRYGATRYRKVNLHDSRFCSIEQTVSMTVARVAEQWYAVYLTDQGRSVMVQEGLPWSEIGSDGRPIGTIPIVPYNFPPGNADSSPPEASPGLSSSRRSYNGSSPTLDQFHPLKKVVPQDEIDVALLASDPFFLLASLLETSLLSWNQLLNVLTEAIKDYQSALELSADELRYHLDQLRYHTRIFYRAKEHASDILALAKQGGCKSWPKPTSDTQQERKRFIQSSLESDCLSLMQKGSLLIAEAESATAVLVSFAQLTASERGIAQAEEVHSLTKLATFFIPLSLTASVFGMNISQWQPPRGPVSIWWFLGTCTVLLSFTFLYLYREWWAGRVVDLWRRTAKRRSGQHSRI